MTDEITDSELKKLSEYNAKIEIDIAKEYEKTKAEFKPRRPDFKSEAVAVWKNYDKNGKEYLAIKIIDGAVTHKYNVFANTETVIPTKD